MKNEPAHFCYIINSTLNHLSLIWFKNAVLGLYVPLPSQSSLNLRSKNAQGSQKKKANCSCPYCLGTSKFGSSPFAVSFQNISKQLYKRAEKNILSCPQIQTGSWRCDTKECVSVMETLLATSGKKCYFKKLPFRNFISPVKARNLWRVLTANGICVCKSAPLWVPPSLSALGPDCGSPWGQPGPSGFDYFTLGIPPAMASCAQELVLAWTVWELDGWALSSSAWGKFWLILAPALLKSRC